MAETGHLQDLPAGVSYDPERDSWTIGGVKVATDVLVGAPGAIRAAGEGGMLVHLRLADSADTVELTRFYPRPGQARLSVKGCARCGEDHERVAFRGLTTPIGPFEWWGMCPKLMEPIMLVFFEDEQPDLPAPRNVKLTDEHLARAFEEDVEPWEL